MSTASLSAPAALTIAPHQTPASPARKAKSQAGRVKGKMIVAMKAIVWEGQELDEAARTAGLTTQAVRLALSRPGVIAWVKAEREVFRAHVSSQNIHRAKEIRDHGANENARVNAMKFIEQIGDDAPGANAQSQPGMLIVVVQQGPSGSTSATIEHKPMQIIDNATGPNRD